MKYFANKTVKRILTSIFLAVLTLILMIGGKSHVHTKGEKFSYLVVVFTFMFAIASAVIQTVIYFRNKSAAKNS